MRQLKIGDKVLTSKDCFIIAEIGSNHMGDFNLCCKMIEAAARCGVDAVKMQKRNNKAMFTKQAYAAPYDNDLSYGKTYGEHREHLDWFGLPEFKRFKEIADDHGVLFFATPFEEESVAFLHALDAPLYKVASCDVTNIPLVKLIAKMGKPMIISTGGASLADITRLVGEVEPINSNFALLHCISTYPNADDQLNLRFMDTMRFHFPNKLVGFSSHHSALLPLYVARTLGASIIEAHFTLNRGFRGTDHGFSLEPHGLETICNDLPRIPVMLGSASKEVYEQEKSGFIRKMGKGIYLKTSKRAGETVKKADICIKSPANGLKPYQIDEIEGKTLLFDTSTGICLKREDFFYE